MTGEQSSGWCTNWSAYNTPRLWAMVAGEDNPEAWRQADAWSAVVVDLEEQLERLQNAQKALCAAWPPGQNEASLTFMRNLGTLVNHMGAARKDAHSTASALENILYALGQAKGEIEPLWRQYKNKNDDIVPAWWDKAEEEIDAKARAHMIAAEAIVQQNSLGIVIPELYEFVALDGRQGDSDPIPDESNPGSSSKGSSSASTGASGMVPHSPPPPMPGHPPTYFVSAGTTGNLGALPSSDLSSSGPVGYESPAVIPPFPHDPPTMRLPVGPELSEVLPPPSPPVLAPAPALPPVGQPGGALPPGGFVPGPGLIPVVVGGSVARSIAGGPTGALTAPSGKVPGVMPSGTVIGQTPMGAYGRATNEGATKAARASVKPSPPSWLAGGVGQSGAAGGGVLPAGSRKNIDATGDDGQRFDPDSPWAVHQGVDSIIEPSHHVSVNYSSPGVIGQQR